MARRPGGARPVTAAPIAVDPLGMVRRSQLISTYGIGAILDLEKGSFMPLGLEDWESATTLASLRINEARLQAQLDVDHFRLPPAAEQVEGTRQVNVKRTAAAVRFPEWHECRRCHRIGEEGDPFELAADGSRLVCSCGPKAFATPVRFVVACRAGHLDEFPWAWWAHLRRLEGECNKPALYLKSRGKSASLADLYLECRNCKTGDRQTSNSLGNAFNQESVRDRPCTGNRPWLGDHVHSCGSRVRVLQRGASNVHFALAVSALSIPPVSEAIFQIIEDNWLTLGAIPHEAIEPVLQNIAAQYALPVELVRTAYNDKKKIEGHVQEQTDYAARAEEYAALSADRDDPVLAGVSPHFRNQILDAPGSIAQWFDLVGAVSRLREVRVLTGFSRIEPYPVSGERVRQAITEGKVSPLSRTHRRWLPAAEIRGEGIFLRFRTDAIDVWIDANPEIGARAAELEARSAAIAAQRGYIKDYQITPRLLLVHSFAHALIRQISIECGYSSSALRERLYVSEPDALRQPMNGVLIYTGSPDSEGSLGGLVRLSEPALLESIVNKTIGSAQWCGSDPVCLETEPATSGDRVSGAACHCCLLLPETACEKFNLELDRTMLVGHPEGNWAGYFTTNTDR